MANSGLDELFSRTLEGEYEDDAPRDAVRELRRLGTRDVFEIASQWCRSLDPLRRARGLDVVAQLGKTFEHRQNSFPEDSFDLVSEVIASEKDIRPLASAIAALGHLDDERGIPLIYSFKQNQSSEVRFVVACALGSFPNHSLSVEALLELMNDEDEEVRDWATFGVGVLGDIDSEEIHEALARALGDVYVEVREEALVGLAKRRDLRVLPFLLRELERESVTDRIIDAACFLLAFESERQEWTTKDYADALRMSFGDHYR